MTNEEIARLDKALVEASRKIRVLTALAWPAGSDEEFLSHWRKGNLKLPEISISVPAIQDKIDDLEAIRKQCDEGHPVGKFLSSTAWSYAEAGRMLQSVGNPEFTMRSTSIYGRPDHKYKTQDATAVDAANFMLDITDQLLGHKAIDDTVYDIGAEDFSKWFRSQTDAFFTGHEVEVVLDSGISARAIAGGTRVRLRESALFSELDKQQLLQHEAFVHSATQLNGRLQPNLKSLGLGAPRTTRTQEGIAVLAELLTNSIDINRLRRIALRVVAVKMALDGADFIELFRFFLQAGQSEIESVRSAQRIFRGGAVSGGVVFTKDGVYLQGLLEVNVFMKLAIRENRPDLVNHLFAGRLTLADTIRLSPQFENGFLAPARYVPDWACDLRRLAALIAYSAFMSTVRIENITLDRVLEFEDELKEPQSF